MTFQIFFWIWAIMAAIWVTLILLASSTVAPILPNLAVALLPLPDGNDIVLAAPETRQAVISAYVEERSLIERARFDLLTTLSIALVPPLLLSIPLLLPGLRRLGRTRLFRSVGRFRGTLWSVWGLASLVWIGLVWATSPIRPTLEDVRLLASDPRPQLSGFLANPTATCEIATIDTFRQNVLGDRPERPVIPEAPRRPAFATAEDYARALSAWQREMHLHAFNTGLDFPHPETLLCQPGPYTEAVAAHHTATRPWRAATARVHLVVWIALLPPLAALALGLLLLWSPLRRKAQAPTGSMS
ncbi:hypothetical protein [Hasllibacter sp. MH4015]|uniref:hypothetical protein n=1 Tax=Hasllibacter sp. MH4015 TaxID=2854029 RepID=UPI001CD3A119|nr:hypothetical protein [Hasllibacter sp. MH4015]